MQPDLILKPCCSAECSWKVSVHNFIFLSFGP